MTPPDKTTHSNKGEPVAVEYSFAGIVQYFLEEYERSDLALRRGDFEGARAILENCRDATAAARRLITAA